MSSKNILICGNYGAGNFGDELILKGLLKAIREIQNFSNLQNLSITVMTANPSETRAWHQVEETAPFVPSSFLSWAKHLLNGNAFRTIRAIQKADLVIFGGGGLLNEKEERSMQIWSSQIRLFRWMQKKIVMVGQSFSTIKKEKNKHTVRKICAAMRKIAVRDTTSKRNLEKLGVKHSIQIIKDSALWLEEADFKASSESSARYILLSLREWPGVNQQELAQKIHILIEEISKTYSMPVKFLALQKGTVITDRKIYNTLQLHTQNIEYVEPKNLNDLWNLVRQSSGFISMRLHGCILAMLAKKPLLALSYDDKVINLLKDISPAPAKSSKTQSSALFVASVHDPALVWLDQLQKSLTQLPLNTPSIKADKAAFQNMLTKVIKTI